MKKFEVRVARVYLDIQVVYVEAGTSEEAEQIAIDEVTGTPSDPEYSETRISFVEEISEEKYREAKEDGDIYA